MKEDAIRFKRYDSEMKEVDIIICSDDIFLSQDHEAGVLKYFVYISKMGSKMEVSRETFVKLARYFINLYRFTDIQ